MTAEFDKGQQSIDIRDQSVLQTVLVSLDFSFKLLPSWEFLQ